MRFTLRWLRRPLLALALWRLDRKRRRRVREHMTPTLAADIRRATAQHRRMQRADQDARADRGYSPTWEKWNSRPWTTSVLAADEASKSRAAGEGRSDHNPGPEVAIGAEVAQILSGVVTPKS